MAFPNRFLLVVLSLMAHTTAISAATPQASCSSENQALVCQYLNSSHIELVSDNLSKLAAEHINFAVAFYNSELEGFPEDFLQSYNITTFAHVADKQALDKFPIMAMLMALRSQITHLYLVASAVSPTDLENLKQLPFRESLLMLDLRYNALVDLEGATFAEFPNLQELNLEGNKIARVAKNSFGGLQQLKKLILSKNDMDEIEEEAFNDLHSLAHLDLSKTMLKTLPKRFFANLENLQFLDISQNPLPDLEKDVFAEEDLPKISEMRLGAIPFLCRCELQWFKTWLTKKGLLKSSGAACITDKLALKQFAVVDFCPDLDDDEVVEVSPTSGKKEENEKEEFDEDDEDFEVEDEEEDVFDIEDEEKEENEEFEADDDYNFREEL